MLKKTHHLKKEVKQMKIFVDNTYFEIVAQHFFGRTLVEIWAVGAVAAAAETRTVESSPQSGVGRHLGSRDVSQLSQTYGGSQLTNRYLTADRKDCRGRGWVWGRLVTARQMQAWGEICR